MQVDDVAHQREAQSEAARYSRLVAGCLREEVEDFRQLLLRDPHALVDRDLIIADAPIPADVKSQGEAAVAAYRDDHRLAFQSDALVNWCPGLGTVLVVRRFRKGHR